MWSDIGQFIWSLLWWQQKPSCLTAISVTVEHLGHAGETNGLNHAYTNVDAVTCYIAKCAEDVTVIKNFTEQLKNHHCSSTHAAEDQRCCILRRR